MKVFAVLGPDGYVSDTFEDRDDAEQFIIDTLRAEGLDEDDVQAFAEDYQIFDTTYHKKG